MREGPAYFVSTNFPRLYVETLFCSVTVFLDAMFLHYCEGILGDFTYGHCGHGAILIIFNGKLRNIAFVLGDGRTLIGSHFRRDHGRFLYARF